MEMQQGKNCMDKQQEHTAETCSMTMSMGMKHGMQDGPAARTSSMGMLLGRAGFHFEVVQHEHAASS
jgi:hypothetical protein